ncbi:IS4 family transposase [Novipirellula maiorica]|uniref:IS4 family transposase n=1 Tax=Novipirellula maiorica TaxID=1265734 RepID=UPI0003451507|nr:IS4 family transposase [Rhodopirellula maiorica]
MSHPNFNSLRSRVEQARRSSDPFLLSLISKKTIQAVFGDASAVLDSARIYNTSVTLWVFLSQVMSIDHGCVAAVARLIVHRVASGLSACSAETGAYCIARDKLDEDSMQRLVIQSGREIEASTPGNWRWNGHRVVTADGTTVTMEDTLANQAEYPQQKAQATGCGQPIARMVVMFALGSGVVLQMAMGKYRGKQTGEISLYREIEDCLGKDDVFLADRAYAGWFDMARGMKRGVHVVVRKHHMRSSDFRTGRRLGKDDHIIVLERPDRRPWMSLEEYLSYPKSIEIREIRIRVKTKGFRTREIIVHTSLLDAERYCREELASLYRRRWQAELNLRSLKTVMQMDHLRCKKPHRVRNEVRAHMLAYNLIRQLMVEAALEAEVEPWQLSFKATLSSFVEILPMLCMIKSESDLCAILYACCRSHTVGNRPDRYEPRRKKRRPKNYKLMQKPRRRYKPNEK